MAPPKTAFPGTRDWWDDLLAASGDADDLPPELLMLRVVVYDITDPRRLARVAKVCEDFGVRVQKSVFECWLEHERLERLLARLEPEMDLDTDQIIVYTLEAKSAARRLKLGHRAIDTEATPDLLIF